jgi:hypothetical protein
MEHLMDHHLVIHLAKQMDSNLGSQMDSMKENHLVKQMDFHWDQNSKLDQQMVHY